MIVAAFLLRPAFKYEYRCSFQSSWFVKSLLKSIICLSYRCSHSPVAKMESIFSSRKTKLLSSSIRNGLYFGLYAAIFSALASKRSCSCSGLYSAPCFFISSVPLSRIKRSCASFNWLELSNIPECQIFRNL